MEQRFEKVVLSRGNFGQRGTLVANGDSLRFESKKGTLPMPKVRSLTYGGGKLTVEYGDSGNYQTVQFVDMSRTGLRANSATRDLERKLRSTVQTVPISAEERAGYEQSVASRKVATGKQGRTQMVIGGLLAVVGIIITIVTYSNASSNPTGGTYFVAYGPMLFGAILFFQGLAASRSSRR